MKTSLSELDPNFQAPIVEDGLAWHTVNPLAVEGVGWAGESQAFCRLPDRAETVVRDAVWQLSRHSAGVLAHFTSDAPQISARWTLRNEALAMPHMPATGVSGLDLYARDEEPNSPTKWRWAGMGRAIELPHNEQVLAQEIRACSQSARRYLLYFPLYNGVSQVQLGVPESSTLRFEPRAQKPICFYGTSIVQGGCAARPGMAYPAIIGRHLDIPTINLGFSGNAHSESEIAALLAELDPAIFVLDPLPNMQLEWIKTRLPHLIEMLRRARPQTPIIVVESITYQGQWLRPPEQRDYIAKNAALQSVMNEMQKAKTPFLHCVRGDSLLGDDGEATVDGVHPTDVGFARMAKAILPVLETALAPL